MRLSGSETITIFLSGDVMTGRGIDQILPHPSDPQLYESHIKSARDYVALAERKGMTVPRTASFEYVWGDALAELERFAPAARLINLETAVTTSDAAMRGKAVHYRMHPANVPCLTAARIDGCVLANNHVLDWGQGGLRETLNMLRQASIKTVGAGKDHVTAATPLIVPVADSERRILVFAWALPTAGVPLSWRAQSGCAGVNTLSDLSASSADTVARSVRAMRSGADLIIVSLHWGGNWGYEIRDEERSFAHRLIDEAGADIVWGHSSHHVKGIEVYRGKLILFGCGDLLTDYEGIGGHESFHPELGLLYFPEIIAKSGQIARLQMVPTRLRGFRIHRASHSEARWLAQILTREGRHMGTHARLMPDNRIELVWT